MSKSPRRPVVSLVEKQTAERRLRILAAARRFVIKHGIEGVNVRALADACRISVPTIYRTFGSKEGLLSEAMQPYLEASVHNEKPSEITSEGYERLLALFEVWSRGFSGAGDDDRAFMGVFLKSESGQHLAWKVSQQIRAEAARTLRQMQERQQLEAWADPAALAARLSAQTVVSAIECAGGTLTPLGYRSAFIYACCLIVLGVALGDARVALLERAEKAQADSLLRPPRHPRD